MDGAMTKAPFGGKKTGPNPTDRAKSGVKRSLLTEGQGVPVGLVVAGANRPDLKLVKETIKSIVVKWPRPTKKRPQGMCLDKGYDYAEVRDTLREFSFTAHIRHGGKKPKRSNAMRAPGRGGGWWSARIVGRICLLGVDSLGQERRDDSAFLHFACALIAFRTSGLFG